MTSRSYASDDSDSIELAELLLERNDEFLFNEFLHLNLMWIKKRQSFLTLSVPSINICFLSTADDAYFITSNLFSKRRGKMQIDVKNNISIYCYFFTNFTTHLLDIYFRPSDP